MRGEGGSRGGRDIVIERCFLGAWREIVLLNVVCCYVCLFVCLLLTLLLGLLLTLLFTADGVGCVGPCGRVHDAAALEPVRGGALHSSTSRLNLSTFCGMSWVGF